MRWNVKPVNEIICRFVIGVALIELVFAVMGLALYPPDFFIYYLGFILVIGVWVALPSLDLYKFEHPEYFKRKME